MPAVCQFPLSLSEYPDWPLEAEREPAEKETSQNVHDKPSAISATQACFPPVTVRRVSQRVEGVSVR